MIVERYLDALIGHDWDVLRDCLTEDVVRVGPYSDEYRGRDAYVGFLSELMPTLPDYRMDVHRVTYAGSLAFAELADDGRIARIDVFIKTAPPR